MKPQKIITIGFFICIAIIAICCHQDVISNFLGVLLISWLSLSFTIYYLFLYKAFAEITFISFNAFLLICFTIVNPRIIEEKYDKPCKISVGQGFHMGSTMAIKFNSDGRFNYSDKFMNIPKSFWGTWKQQGNKIITTNDRSTTGMGIGQQNTYTYDCDVLTISGFTLVKD